MSSSGASLYRIFKRVDGAAPMRAVIVAMIACACAITAVGVIRVQRQHEVLQLGYRLSRAEAEVRDLREAQRRLEVERATLTAPERIRHLATELGMTTVAPDKIRIVHAAQAASQAALQAAPQEAAL